MDKIELRSNPDTKTLYILSTYDIHHFVYKGTDVYYKKTKEDDTYEWDVRFDEPDIKIEGNLAFLLRPVKIRCTSEVFGKTMIYKGLVGYQIDEAIIIAGLKKEGLL